jgi:hypothetical protein
MAAERTGWDEIRSGYDMYKSYPYWGFFETQNANSIKPGRLIFGYTEDDRDTSGWKLLEENLKVAENSSPFTRFLIQFYNELDKNDSINDKMPAAGSFLLRMKTNQGTQPAAISGIGLIPAEGSLFLQYLQTELRIKEEKIQELEEENAELHDTIDEYERSDRAPKINGMIGQIGEAATQYPVLGEILKEFAGGLKTLFTRPGATNRAPGALAGVETDTPPTGNAETADQVIGKCIKKLAGYYVGQHGYFKEGITEEQKETANRKGWISLANDMVLLANLTDDPELFEVAIIKLRKVAG